MHCVFFNVKTHSTLDTWYSNRPYSGSSVPMANPKHTQKCIYFITYNVVAIVLFLHIITNWLDQTMKCNDYYFLTMSWDSSLCKISPVWSWYILISSPPPPDQEKFYTQYSKFPSLFNKLYLEEN